LKASRSSVSNITYKFVAPPRFRSKEAMACRSGWAGLRLPENEVFTSIRVSPTMARAATAPAAPNTQPWWRRLKATTRLASRSSLPSPMARGAVEGSGSTASTAGTKVREATSDPTTPRTQKAPNSRIAGMRFRQSERKPVTVVTAQRKFGRETRCRAW
jgi:hypothetical protein